MADGLFSRLVAASAEAWRAYTRHEFVLLLAKGELRSALTIEVAGASKAAVAAVESAGGKITLRGGRIPKPKKQKEADGPT